MTIVVPPTLSVLVSIWTETLFFGFNTVVYLLCLYMLIARGRHRNWTTRVLLGLSTALFLSAAAHISVNFRRLIEGYVDPATKADMTRYLVDITQPTNVAKQYFLVMVNLFSDMLIAWRVYLVWEMNLLVAIIPALLCVGAFVTGIVVAVYEGLVVPGQNVFLDRIAPWATSQYSCSFAMNVLSATLIASRIWYVTREIRKLHPSAMRPYWRIIVIIIESASVAAVIQVVELAFYESKFPGVYFIGDTTVQIVTLAPLLIVALVGLNRKNERSTAGWGTSYATSPELSGIRFDNGPLPGTRDMVSTRDGLHSIQFNTGEQSDMFGRSAESRVNTLGTQQDEQKGGFGKFGAVSALSEYLEKNLTVPPNCHEVKEAAVAC